MLAIECVRYWGDFFFLMTDQTLVFDGIFEMFPHPMYSVGYSFFYGSALLTRSYPVLYVSLAAHAAQLVFLAKVCFLAVVGVYRK